MPVQSRDQEQYALSGMRIGRSFSIDRHLHDRALENRSALEVSRSYQTALEDGGFSVIFMNSQTECGGRDFNHALSPLDYYLGFGECDAERQYTLARLQREEGDVYAGIYVVLKADEVGGDLAHVSWLMRARQARTAADLVPVIGTQSGYPSLNVP